MNGSPRTRRDLLLAGAAALLGVAPFLPTVPFCGIYLDDYPFLSLLEGASPHDLWIAFLRYVPGRNLHIPFLRSSQTDRPFHPRNASSRTHLRRS